MHRSSTLLRALGVALICVLTACGGGGSDGSDGRGAGSGGEAAGSGGESGEEDGPSGAGVVAAEATPFTAPTPAVAPTGAGAPAPLTCLADPIVEDSQRRLGLGAVIGCDQPHVAQVVAVVGLPRDEVDTFVDGGQPMTGGVLSAYAFAGVQVFTETRIACRDTFDALAASALDLGGDQGRRVWKLREEVRIPSPDEWDAGARWGACVLEATPDAPITGVPDVTAVPATTPMPIGLQVCGNVTGRAVPCDGEIVQVQQFLEIDVAVPEDSATGLVAGDEKRRATEACAAALERYAPDLAEGGQVVASAQQVMEQETRPEGGGTQMMGQPRATCVVSPTAAKGLGLPGLVP